MNSMLAWVVQLSGFLDVVVPSSEMRQGPISKKAPSMLEPPGPLQFISHAVINPETLGCNYPLVQITRGASSGRTRLSKYPLPVSAMATAADTARVRTVEHVAPLSKRHVARPLPGSGVADGLVLLDLQLSGGVHVVRATAGLAHERSLTIAAGEYQ